MSVCFAVTAQANVLEDYGAYKGTFTGQEVVFTNDGNLVTNPTWLLQTGLKMYALSVIERINTTQGAGSNAVVDYPPVFNSLSSPGTYFTTLTGLTASNIVATGQQTYDIYFTGGTLNWYYSDNMALNNTLHYMRYNTALGDYAYQGTTLGDLLPDPFMVADLIGTDPEYTGKVTVTLESGAVLRTEFTFYANVQEGYEAWQSGAYGNDNGGTGFDMEFGGKLVWGSEGRFYINDGNFRVASAPTPEPSSIILMSLGLLLTAAFVRRQQKNK